ncbi:CPBP family intramembrane metalloprotease [Ectobacillus sp. JY-23]|uniref:CPBP family intramembrane glutamic endopeptidase n=1 Tax=Ectobacillus sp. JY-23 TaxID=2933872 RepID=UPI001FF5A373|nr:CPBP family intramembrane glutamic endopeptidase [Ectobacillus sp. JY-23]UOY94292.1 CPBP family intramembrane metalloprotease [Ectobacillus sp. JY-23]
MCINLFIFLPFILKNEDISHYKVWWLAIAFALINASLEELIWRGILLTRFSTHFGASWGIAITSLGFGLQHYSLGFPWLICLLFSMGGFFYGWITVKAESIYPAVIWHIGLNMLMVLSGFIL